MRVPGLKTFKQTARWLRSRFVGGALILGYHRVAEATQDIYGLCVSPERFAEQLQVIRHYMQPISLRELSRGLHEGSLPKRAVALTFDDGYADNLYQAKPLLAYYQIPATVFATTSFLGKEFWWDELKRLLLAPATVPERLALSVNGDCYEWTLNGTSHSTLDKGTSSSRQHLLGIIYERLLELSGAEREQALRQMRNWSGAKFEGWSQGRALTPDELVELASAELIEIGAHTVTHPILAKLPLKAQQTEIQQSKTCLEALLGQPVVGFSYPNGSLSAETVGLVRAVGFDYACASYNDVAWRGSDRFYLPRFWIPNWTGAQFSQWLQRWLPG
jgi:peptidoglycan/xylan/chitin deacetylase (PgdA/CDA1 family)